jgi:hypothetical protein
MARIVLIDSFTGCGTLHKLSRNGVTAASAKQSLTNPFKLRESLSFDLQASSNRFKVGKVIQRNCWEGDLLLISTLLGGGKLNICCLKVFDSFKKKEKAKV